MQLLIDNTPAGSTVADGSGSFHTPVTVSVPLGQHTVTAQCGATLQSVLAVVLTSQAGPPPSTASFAVIILFLLLLLLAWQLRTR